MSNKCLKKIPFENQNLVEMKVVRIFFLILVVISFFIVSSVSADGKVFLEENDDSWIVGKELSQRAVISHNGKTQKMNIAVDVLAKGKSGIWIFPVPAKVEDIKLDVYEGFSVPKGILHSKYVEKIQDELAESLSYSLVVIGGSTTRLFFMRAFTSIFFGEEFDGLSSYKTFSKLGLESEVVQAKTPEDLFGFFLSRGLEIPVADQKMWKQYHQDGYSFIVSKFIATHESPVGEDGEKQLSLLVEFPTEKAFFPLKPSQTYESAEIPLEVYVEGYMSVSVPESLSKILDIDYVLNKGSREITHTKVSFVAPANLLLDDMWFEKDSFFVLKRMSINILYFLSVVAPFVILGILVVSLYIFFKRKNKFLFLLLLGGLAMLYFFRKNRSDNKFLKFGSKFILSPLILISAFGDIFVLFPLVIIGGIGSMILTTSSHSGVETSVNPFAYSFFNTIEGSFSVLLMYVGIITYITLIIRLFCIFLFWIRMRIVEITSRVIEK